MINRATPLSGSSFVIFALTAPPSRARIQIISKSTFSLLSGQNNEVGAALGLKIIRIFRFVLILILTLQLEIFSFDFFSDYLRKAADDDGGTLDLSRFKE